MQNDSVFVWLFFIVSGIFLCITIIAYESGSDEVGVFGFASLFFFTLAVGVINHITARQREEAALPTVFTPPTVVADVRTIVTPEAHRDIALLRCSTVFDSADGDLMCAICFDPLGNGEICSLPCAHLYHEECIGKWFMRKPTCPICQRSVFV